jgi:hypothetical protein
MRSFCLFSRRFQSTRTFRLVEAPGNCLDFSPKEIPDHQQTPTVGKGMHCLGEHGSAASVKVQEIFCNRKIDRDRDKASLFLEGGASFSLDASTPALFQTLTYAA